MKVGDLVIRKVNAGGWNEARGPAREQRRKLGYGLVLSKQMAGRNPTHSCITVFYSKVGKSYDISESLMEVINVSS
ncbi:hypothetical protein OAA09_01030 [bacterium]|nr:hypothetical protein [bacterium]